jgi:protein ImuB
METPASTKAPAFSVLLAADFPLQALRRSRHGRERDAPLGLLSGSHRRAVILAACAQARADGVTLGSSPSQALARCPRLQLLPADPSAEAEAAAALLAVGFSLSPVIEETDPGVCTLDLSGHATHQREPRLRAAVAQLRELDLQVSAGLAATPLLALYAARECAAGEVRTVEHPRAFLAGLPLSAAAPPETLQSILARWGVRTLGDLTDLPRAEIARRLGAEGLALWERAAGKTIRPLTPARPTAHFIARHAFDHEVGTLEPVHFILRRLLDRLCLDLANASFAASRMELQLHLEDPPDSVSTIPLPDPCSDPATLFRVLATRLESLHTASPVVGLTLRLAPTRPLLRQPGLLDATLRDPHSFAETLSRTIALVGPDRTGTPTVEDSRRPDAFRLSLPPTSLSPPPSSHPTAPPLVLGPPLRRFRPPRPAWVELSEHRPSFVRSNDVAGEVTACVGPWLASGEWWRADLAWQREEWDVRLDSGGLYRLLHLPEGWQLEGEYD